MAAVTALLATGCGGESATDDAWRDSGYPGGAQASDRLTVTVVEPDDGVAPVVDFIDSATSSLDLGTYEINPDFAPITDALLRAVDRGWRSGSWFRAPSIRSTVRRETPPTSRRCRRRGSMRS